MTTWPGSRSPRPRPPGCASSGWTAGRWPRRPGPGCCCGSPIRSSWRRARTMQAAGILAGLPGPFTAAEARQALHTTRRVAIPLLEYLDRRGLTRRLPDDRRTVTGSRGWHRRPARDRAAPHTGRTLRSAAAQAAAREPLAAPGGRLGGRLIRADPADQRLGRHRGEQDPGPVVPGGQPGVAETVDPVDDREPVGMAGPEAAPGVVGAQPAAAAAASRTGRPGCCR